MTVTGKTVEAAVEEALARLSASRDQVKITVLEEPSKGFFGWIGVRNAKVEVEKNPTPREEAHRFLREVLDTMGLQGIDLETTEESDHVRINFHGDQLGILIGRRGQTLDALQYLTNIIANKAEGAYVRFILDAQGYRNRRRDTLLALADRIAKQVIRTKKPVTLEPMNPMERKVIHTQIQKYKELTTTSEGEDPHRKVVVLWKASR
ncbi:RNA-binding cell elongation regulator Jag/EloR [Salinithrix halophila]|uniref:RNA-binding protein KhpB n=1 Tax=Salinithrix halophila TaxID=1485204 RepID=A0ABV8JKE3_9BACL